MPSIIVIKIARVLSLDLLECSWHTDYLSLANLYLAECAKARSSSVTVSLLLRNSALMTLNKNLNSLREVLSIFDINGYNSRCCVCVRILKVSWM